jgi:serine/threonine-protein phosphatase 5
MFFEYLPLAHVACRGAFVVHGGLSKDLKDARDLKGKDRCWSELDGVLSDHLWADPQAVPGFTPSAPGSSFGPDVTAPFLRDSALEYVICGRRVKREGFEWAHDGKCLTLFSAPNYDGTQGNKGAVCVLTKSGRPQLTSFEKTRAPMWQAIVGPPPPSYIPPPRPTLDDWDVPDE